MRRIVIIFLLGLASLVLAQQSPNAPYTPFYFLKFGDYLFEKNDYLRAATEYERFLFFQKPDTFPRVYYKVGLSYYRLEAYSRAKHFFATALSKGPSATLQDSLQLGLTAITLRTEPQPNPDQILNTPSHSRFATVSLRFRLYAALAALKNSNYRRALSMIPEQALSDSSDTQYGFFRVKKLAQKGLHLPHKAPWKAALLSSIIPGSGKFYTENRGDGLYSFLLVVGTGLLSYRGYKRGDPFQTYFFGASAIFFYTGNIYGSYLSAKLFNRKTKENLLHEIQDEIHYWTNL